MFVQMITNTAKHGHEDAYLAASRRFAADMTATSGCLASYVWQATDDPAVVVNVNLWESAEACAADDGSTFLAHKAELKPHFAGNVTTMYEVR